MKKKSNQLRLETCDVCGLPYVSSNQKDIKLHEKHHRLIVESYEQTLAEYNQQPIKWFRPKVENFGVYQALNELNPRLIGFTYSGINETDWQAIQQGVSELPIGRTDKQSGDGHDRYGEWISPSGVKFSFHANWSCGHIHFLPTEKSE